MAEIGSMERNLKRFLLLVCVSLSFVVASILVTLGFMAPSLRITFSTYQFFLMGACVGALTLATVGLILEWNEWNHYKAYLGAVMTSVFLLTMVNCVIFRILGGEQFIRRLVKLVWGFLNVG